MHKKTKGSIAELAVAMRLVREGWRVLFPYGENTRYDLVAEREGRFVKIQVKYVTVKAGVLCVNCQSSNNWSVLPYTPEEIDAIAVYDAVNEQIFFVPVTEIRKGHMKLRIDPPRNNQRAKIQYAKEFSELHDGHGHYQVNGNSAVIFETLAAVIEDSAMRAGA